MSADKQTPPNEAGVATAEPAKPSRKKTLLLVAMLMLVEGVAVFFAAKMLGAGPISAGADHGSEEHHSTADDHGDGGGHGSDAAKSAPFASDFGEVAVSECRPTNRISGRLTTFRMRVSVLVKASDLEKTKNMIEANKSRLDDRISFVIRSAEPESLNEPTLETIKRRLKAEFERLMGNNLVEEVLIPEMLPSAPGL